MGRGFRPLGFVLSILLGVTSACSGSGGTASTTPKGVAPTPTPTPAPTPTPTTAPVTPSCTSPDGFRRAMRPSAVRSTGRRRATAAESSLITEYTLPAGFSVTASGPEPGPQGIVTGPDGALWFGLNPNTDNNMSGMIGRITTAGQLTTYPGNGVPQGALGGVDGIAVGNDGALWFTALEIDRMTTAGVLSNRYDDCDAYSGNIVSGPDGALWFTSNGGTAIGRMTLGGALTYYPVVEALYQFGAGSIADGPDGAMWFTGVGTPIGNELPVIGRITTSGVITQFPVDNTSSQPGGITAGADGALWFTDASTNSIGRMTTSGAVLEYPIPTANSGPANIAAGPDGALWFTEYAAGQIGRITIAGTVTEYASWPGSIPNYITAGPDGNIWFTDSSGAIGKLTL